MPRDVGPAGRHRILSGVRESLLRPGFNVDELRAELGLRDNTVAEQFRTAIGVNLHTYIEDCRLEGSCRLLLGTDFLVETIGRLVGYELPRTFNRAFHRRVGCSPTEWRESRAAAGRWPGPRCTATEPPLRLPRVDGRHREPGRGARLYRLPAADERRHGAASV